MIRCAKSLIFVFKGRDATKTNIGCKGQVCRKKILVWNISPGDLNSIQIKWARWSWPLCISPVEELYKKI